MARSDLYDYCPSCNCKVELEEFRFWGECGEFRKGLPVCWSANGSTGIPHKDDEFDLDALGYYNNAKRLLED
jgi:hypothetical protein